MNIFLKLLFILSSDEKVQSKRNKKQRALHLIKESDEKDSLSNKSKESAHSATSAVDETESMLFAVMQQNDLSRYPERGILKNGPVRVNSELETCADDDDRRRSNGIVPTGGDGYESEPPYPAFRVFENSMRKLNECDPYRRRSNNHNGEQDPPYVSYAGSAASAPVSRRTASSICPYAPPTNVRSGYCTDEDRRLPAPQRRYIDSSPDMPSSSSPPSQRMMDGGGGGGGGGQLLKQQQQNLSSLRSSPTNSAGSPTGADVGRSLSQAQPLKLKNIEYLLKQLDRKSNASLSPTSSAELSVPEADKETDDILLEESSNTESHRDGQYAVRRDFPNEYGNAVPSLMLLNVGKTAQYRPSTNFNHDINNYSKYGSASSSSDNNRLPSSTHQLSTTPPTLNRLNLINYSQSNICSSCQLPTPDHCCGGGGDGRVSSDGSCDNNVCICKSMRNEK